ncbi:hypothetical protein [Xanthomonas phage RTH11]|nr:hypothetical protein [Xanthomonas phage RTH11]
MWFMPSDMEKSADLQALDRVLPLLKEHTSLYNIIASVEYYRGQIVAKDAHVQTFESLEDATDRLFWFRSLRTFFFNFGHGAGTTMLAQLLAHEKMIVFVHTGPTNGLAEYRGNGVAPPSLPAVAYDGIRAATVVTDPVSFIEKLQSGQFESAMIYGSRSLLDLDPDTDPSEFLDLIATNLHGNLPAIHVLL